MGRIFDTLVAIIHCKITRAEHFEPTSYLKHWGRPIRGQIVGYGSGHPLPTPVDEFEASGPRQSSQLLHRVNHASYMTSIVPGPEIWRSPCSRPLLPRTTLQSALRYHRATRSHTDDEWADPVGLQLQVGSDADVGRVRFCGAMGFSALLAVGWMSRGIIDDLRLGGGKED